MNKIIYAVATLAIVGCVLATVLVVTNDSSDAQRTKRTKV